MADRAQPGGLRQDSAEEGAAEIGIDLDAVEAEAAEGEAEDGEGGDDEARRALLLYQEGTGGKIYPFTGEVLTIGRGATTTSRSRTTPRCRASLQLFVAPATST